MRVGLISGTGEEGRGLALRFAMAGARVIVGSRTLERAQTTAEQLNAELGRPAIEYALNQEAIASSEFVLLTVPFQHAAATLQNHASAFTAQTVLIDITVPLSFDGGRVHYLELPEGSGSEHLRARLPKPTPIVAAFKTEPAHLLSQLDQPLDCDCFIASDDKDAKTRVIQTVSAIEGLRAVDAGPLSGARALERMTVLAIGINRRYKIQAARYRVVGLP